MSDSTISTEPEPLTLTLATTSPAVDEPQQVFDHWITATNRTPRTRFTKERRRKVTQALKAGYTVADLTAAINGCLASPHHQGHNDTGTVYDDLELICRNETQIEKMIGYGERTPIRKPSVYQESADIVDQVFAAREQQTLNEISR